MEGNFAELNLLQVTTVIPRSFGTGKPVMLLDSRKRIRRELNMLASLDEIRLSAYLAKEIHLRDNGHAYDETLGKYFKELGLKNIEIGSKLFSVINALIYI